MNIEFTVYGVPQPQGSTRAFMPKGARFPVVTTDNAKLKPWRQQITGCALAEMNGQSPSEGYVQVRAKFCFDKPKSRKKDVHKTTKPDVDKLLRGLFDSLTGIVFRDDSQIIECSALKVYDSPARAEVQVWFERAGAAGGKVSPRREA